MRLSRQRFLQMLAGGTATTAAMTASDRSIAAQTPIPMRSDVATDHQPRIEPAPRVGGPYREFAPEAFYDIVDRTLYDRLQFKPGQTIPANFGMFQTPIGHNCPYTHRQKMRCQTNGYIACGLPAPTLFWIRRIHLLVDPDTDAEALRALRQYGWSFWIMNKRYHDGLVAMDAQKATLADLLTPTRQSLELDASNGLFIPMQTYFKGEFQATESHPLSPDGSGLDFTMALEGVEARGVQ